MDAGWIAVVVATMGVSFESRGPNEGVQLPTVSSQQAAHSTPPAGVSDGVTLPHLARHTARQPISSSQLEAGFAEAHQPTPAQSQQAIIKTQFTTPVVVEVEPERTIGGEVRKGTGRLLDRAGTAIERTGDAIGGTARNLRDGVRSVLPRNRTEAQPVVAVPVTEAPAYQPYSYSAPASVAVPGTTPLPTNPQLETTAPVPPVLPATTPTATGITAPPLASATTPAGNGLPNLGPAAVAQPNESSVLIDQPASSVRPFNGMTPVTQPPFVSTTSGVSNQGASQPFFGSSDRFGRKPSDAAMTSASPIPSVPFGSRDGQYDARGSNGYNNGFGQPRPTGAGTGFVGVLQGNQPTGLDAPTPNQGFPSLKQPANANSYNASVDPRQVNPGQPARDPFGRIVARPPQGDEPPIAGPGATLTGGGIGMPGQHTPTGAPLTPPGDLSSCRTPTINTPEGLPPTPTGSRDPWTETVLATLIAVGSVGGNVFLGWSYLDARNKYRSALRRTARTFGRASSLDD